VLAEPDQHPNALASVPRRREDPGLGRSPQALRTPRVIGELSAAPVGALVPRFHAVTERAESIGFGARAPTSKWQRSQNSDWASSPYGDRANLRVTFDELTGMTVEVSVDG